MYLEVVAAAERISLVPAAPLMGAREGFRFGVAVHVSLEIVVPRGGVVAIFLLIFVLVLVLIDPEAGVDRWDSGGCAAVVGGGG